MKPIQALMTLLTVLILFSPATTYACSPAEPQQYIYDVPALLYGRAIKASRNKRAATLEVISYVGPGQAPTTTELPELKVARSNCTPLNAGTFSKDQEYLIVLTELPTDLGVIPADQRKVLYASEGQIRMDFHGKMEPIEEVLATFAKTHGLRVQDPSAPMPANYWPWLAGATLLLVALLVINQQK